MKNGEFFKIFVCVILSVNFLGRAQSETKNTDKDTFFQHLINPILNLPSDLEAGIVTPENKPNWLPISLLLGSTVGAVTSFHVKDEPFGKSNEKPKLGDASKRISDIGYSFVLALPIGFYTAGVFLSTGETRSRAFDLGEQLVETLLLTQATTLVMKYTAGRTRPDLSDRKSMPSGHASLAFAGATTLALNTPWYVGVPAILGAGLVAASRIDLHKHFLSDVVIGAGIGAFFSSSVWSHRRFQANKKALAWQPWIGTDSLGLTFVR